MSAAVEETALDWTEALRGLVEADLPVLAQYASGANPGDLLGPEFWIAPVGIVSTGPWIDGGFEHFAIITGPHGRNGKRYVGVDLDVKDGRNGLAFLAEFRLRREDGIETPNGGLHFVFECPDDVDLASFYDPPDYDGVELKAGSTTSRQSIRVIGPGYEPFTVDKVLPWERFPAQLLELPEAQPHEHGEAMPVEYEGIAKMLDALDAKQVNYLEHRGVVEFCCLLHQETRPSAAIILETGGFNCYVCGGHALDTFYARATNPTRERLDASDYFQARRMLRSKFGIEVAPPSRNGDSPDVADEADEPQEDKPSHSWVALDLIALGDEPPTPPEIMGLLYCGSRNLFSGEFESIKSMMGLAACVEEVTESRGVVWVDCDNMGPRATLERLRQFGLSDEEIAAYFCYMRPGEPFGDAASEHALELLSARSGRLVVFDAFNSAMSLQGLDPMKTVEIDEWYQTVSDPFANEGVASTFLDHVVKSSDDRGRYSYGGERKVSGADTHLGSRIIDQVGRGRSGAAKITVHKDRHGFIREAYPNGLVFRLNSDPETGALSWKLEADESVTPEGDFRPDGLMYKVSRYLERADEARSRSQIRQDVQGKHDYVLAAVECLLDEGYVREIDRKGRGGGKAIQLVRAFRNEEADERSPFLKEETS